MSCLQRLDFDAVRAQAQHCVCNPRLYIQMVRNNDTVAAGIRSETHDNFYDRHSLQSFLQNLSRHPLARPPKVELESNQSSLGV
jgi:hypothetical protein